MGSNQKSAPFALARPADLPAHKPAKYELTINLKTAKALGLDVPLSLRGRAEAVINSYAACCGA